MEARPDLDEMALVLYERLKTQRKVTPWLVQRHAKVNGDTALRLCERIWRMLRNDARKWAEEVYNR